MQPVRVCLLVTRLVAGGAERQMVTLAEHLPRDVFDVEFLALSGPGVLDERARIAGIPVRYLDGEGGAADTSLVRTGKRARKAFRYVTWARARRYDVVDAWLPPNDILAALTRRLTLTSAVVGGRRNLWDFSGSPGVAGRTVRRLANRSLDAVVVNSRAVAEDVTRHEGLPEAKLRLIPNGVRPIADPAPGEVATERRRLALDANDLVVACVASLTEVKRVDLVLRAHAALLAEQPGLRLVVVGDGPRRAELERLAHQLGTAGALRFTGSVADPERLVRISDVVVQGSRTEGLPNALLEAASAGRAIVATDVGGTREVLDNGKCGILVPPNDARALADALRPVVTDAAMRGRLGDAARAHVGRAFSIDRFVSAFADLYRNLLPDARRRTGSSIEPAEPVGPIPTPEGP